MALSLQIGAIPLSSVPLRAGARLIGIAYESAGSKIVEALLICCEVRRHRVDDLLINAQLSYGGLILYRVWRGRILTACLLCPSLTPAPLALISD